MKYTIVTGRVTDIDLEKKTLDVEWKNDDGEMECESIGFTFSLSEKQAKDLLGERTTVKCEVDASGHKKAFDWA